MADVGHDRKTDPLTFRGVKRRPTSNALLARLRKLVRRPEPRGVFSRADWSEWLLSSGWCAHPREVGAMQQRLLDAKLVEPAHLADGQQKERKMKNKKNKRKKKGPFSGGATSGSGGKKNSQVRPDNCAVLRRAQARFCVCRSVHAAAEKWEDGSPFPQCTQPIFAIDGGESTLFSRRLKGDSFRFVMPSTEQMMKQGIECARAVMSAGPGRRGPDGEVMLHFVLRGLTLESREHAAAAAGSRARFTPFRGGSGGGDAPNLEGFST